MGIYPRMQICLQSDVQGLEEVKQPDILMRVVEMPPPRQPCAYHAVCCAARDHLERAVQVEWSVSAIHLHMSNGQRLTRRMPPEDDAQDRRTKQGVRINLHIPVKGCVSCAKARPSEYNVPCIDELRCVVVFVMGLSTEEANHAHSII